MGNEAADIDPAIPKVTIHVLRGKATATSREMKGRSLLVGSGPQCDIQMRSADVAAKHALLTRGPEGVVIRQLDTDYPLVLNGQVVAESPVANGDNITLGPFELSVTIVGGIAPPRPTPPSVAVEPIRTPPPVKPAESNLPRRLEEAMRGLARYAQSSTVPSVEKETSVPEKLVEIQRAQADTEKEIERRRRQMYDELARLEGERNAFKQEKARFETQRQEVDRQLKAMAQREGDIARLSREMEEKARAHAEAERILETKKIADDEESIRLDRRAETIEARKLKLLRVRRRLLQQYRGRRQTLAQVSLEMDERTGAIRDERTKHETDVLHWKRVAEELGRKQADLKRLDAEIRGRLELVDRREAELRDRQSRFEGEIGQIQVKDKTLDTLRVDLDRRKNRIAEEEQTLRDARKAVEEQFERAKQRSAEVQRRHEEVEARRMILDKQEQYLRDQAATLEKQRLDMAGMDRELANRHANSDARDSELLARVQQLEAGHNDLRIREIALADQLEAVRRKEELLKEWEGQITLDQQELDRRTATSEEDTRARLMEIEEQRRRIEDRHREIESIHRNSQEAHESIEQERDSWAERMQEVREQASEIAHRESIVHARQKQLVAAERADRLAEHSPGPLFSTSEGTVPKSPVSPVGDNFASETELARLREQSLDIDQAEKSLHEEESTWSAELKTCRAKMERYHRGIERRQALLAKQASMQKQRAGKLRDLTDRLFGRSPTAAPRVDQIREREESKEQKLHDAEHSQAALAAQLLEAISYTDEQQILSSRWISQQESDRQHRAQLNNDATRAYEAERKRTGAVAPGPSPAMQTWATALDTAEQAIQSRRQQISGEREKLHRMLESWPALLDETNDFLPASTPPPAASVIPQESPLTAVLKCSDDDLVARLRQAQLIDDMKIPWVKQSAQSSGSRLAEEIVRLGLLTPYQLRAAVQGDMLLKLGAASVLDLIHDGAIATTFKIRLPGAEGPLAARMLKSQWSRDPAMRRQYEIVLDSLKHFAHPNVVPIRGSLLAGDRFGVLTDCVDAVSLASVIPFGVPAGVLMSVCHQSLGAIAAAERAGLAHRALRPSRLLFGRGGELRLIGYGEPDSLIKMHRCERGRSSQPFVAPELLDPSATVDARADVYSIAMIASRIILAESGAASLRDATLRELHTDSFLQLLEKMSSPQASARPTAAEARAVLETMADPNASSDWPDLTLVFQQMQETHSLRFAA